MLVMGIMSLAASSALAQTAPVCGVHNGCVAGKCITVPGEGLNGCQTDADCNATHNECVNNQCALVPGIGINQCQNNGDCANPKHNECNAQKQCVVVSGAGIDQCKVTSDCREVVIFPDPPPPPGPPGIIPDIIRFFESPVVSTATTSLATTGAIVVTVATATALVDVHFSFAQLFLLPFGFATRKKPWGVVYDSVTKRPIDPAYVILKALDHAEDASSITDLDGRYGFLAQAGTYAMTATKTHYAFPSKNLQGRTTDELYDNLYFGGAITIKKDDDVIINNIPMDPVDFDWNEFAKKDKNLYSFYSKFDFVLRKVSDVVFAAGFLFSGFALISAQTPYNMVVFGMYVAFFGARLIGFKPRPLGYVYDKKTGKPLSFALIHVMLPELNTQVAHAVTDKFGRYYCLVGKGKYYLKIDAKNPDASYTTVYTSPIIDTTKTGIIKQRFAV